MGKGKIVAAVPIMVVVAVFISYFYGWEISSYFHKDSTVYSMEELSSHISEQLDQGRTSAILYIQGVSESELNKINDYVRSNNGMVSQFTVQEKSRSGMKVHFKYDISDNYYVINKYLYNIDIPSDRAQAYKLYEFVDELIDTIIKDGMSDYEKELAIHDYIVTNCEYGYVEYAKDYAYRAYGCLVQNTAVCNGYAEAMSLLLTCVGIDNIIVTGEGREELHAWNQVCIDGEWYNVDATWDDPLPDRGDYAGHMFFNVTDDVMDDDHKWDREYYNICDEEKQNYFIKNDLVCDYDMMVSKLESIAEHNPMATAEMVLTDYSDEKYLGFSFICDNPGVQYYTYSMEDYGDYKIATIYLNQRE